MLSCIGCAIFGISEVPTEGINFDVGDFAYMNAEAGTAPGPGSAAPPSGATPNKTVYVPPPPPEPTPAPASEGSAVPAPETDSTPSDIVSQVVEMEENCVDDATCVKASGLPACETIPASEIGELD